MSAIIISIFLSPKDVLVERAFYVMGTTLEFRLYCESKEFCNEAIFDAYSEVKRLDDMLSNYKADSELSRVNLLAGNGEVPIPPEFTEVVERSLFFSKMTEGAFDISVGELAGLWRNGQQKNAVPDSEAIKKAVLECVGYQKIKLHTEENEIDLKSPCLSIDFGGIGKGFAIDRAVGILREKGVKSGLINFSGNFYAIGTPPGSKGWVIGVQDPRRKKEALTRIRVKDLAVSTSGDYERFFEIKSKRFSHILDPRTGYPVDNVPSVTVVAENATDADALSTGISVMGKEKSIEVLGKLEGSGAMIVTFEKKGLSIHKDPFFRSLEITDSGSDRKMEAGLQPYCYQR